MLEKVKEEMQKIIDADLPIKKIAMTKEAFRKKMDQQLKSCGYRFLVIEGIHCLNDQLTAEIPKDIKYKVYISDLTVLNLDYYNNISTTDTRLIRRIVRDNDLYQHVLNVNILDNGFCTYNLIFLLLFHNSHI